MENDEEIYASDSIKNNNKRTHIPKLNHSSGVYHD